MTAEQLSFHLCGWISSPETRSRFKAKDTAQVVEGGQCSPVSIFHRVSMLRFWQEMEK